MNNDVIDFTNCKRVHRSYGGSDRKFGVYYDGRTYMLKFSENHAKKSDISSSYVNNVLSEYISSHIAQTAGLPAHNTMLGYYKDEIVVACQDFRQPGDENIEFGELMRSSYDSHDVKRIAMLSQIYETIKDPVNNLPEDLQKESIERYWDTFVVDGLVGNFDRHIGNWGYLANNNNMRLAPAYDFGSTLFPKLSDMGMEEMMSSSYEMRKRCLVFPSPALCITRDKVGKVGYYDMMSSDYDRNCSEAVRRMVPKINIKDIYDIIDGTPLITDTRKRFYKEILSMRKELILDRAYECCMSANYDEAAHKRILTGKQYTEEMLKESMLFQLDKGKENSENVDEAILKNIISRVSGIRREFSDIRNAFNDTLVSNYNTAKQELKKSICKYTIQNKNNGLSQDRTTEKIRKMFHDANMPSDEYLADIDVIYKENIINTETLNGIKSKSERGIGR